LIRTRLEVHSLKFQISRMRSSSARPTACVQNRTHAVGRALELCILDI